MTEDCILPVRAERGTVIRVSREHRKQDRRIPFERAEWRPSKPFGQCGMERPRVERGIERALGPNAETRTHTGEGVIEQAHERWVTAPRRGRGAGENASHQSAPERMQRAHGGGGEAGAHEGMDR